MGAPTCVGARLDCVSQDRTGWGRLIKRAPSMHHVEEPDHRHVASPSLPSGSLGDDNALETKATQAKCTGRHQTELGKCLPLSP